MRKILLIPIFTALIVFSIGSSNAYASSSYEIGPNDPNQSCEKLGGSFVSGFRFECDVGTNATLSAGDTITIDPFSRLDIFNGATLDVNGGAITIKSGTVFGNLATSGGTVTIRNGGTIDVFGSIAVFQGAVINEAGGTVVNTGGTIAINGGAFINECGTLVNNGQIVNGQVQNECSTTTILSSSLNPSASGQPVEFTAIVSPSSGTIPDGETMTFYKNGTSVGTGATSGGSAAFTTSFTNAGSYSITATYPGDSNFPSSTSNEVIQDVTNTPPVANPDSYTVNENTALSVSTATGVLTNDNDPDGDILTASLVTDTSHGTMTLNLDGSFTYTPNSDFAGSDSFVYQTDDGHGHTVSTTDAITVNQIVCPAGSFLSSGANTCTLAPPGSYVPSPGAISSTLCPVGTFTDTIGQSSCNPSPAGSFVNTTGATSATQCDAGTFQPNTGQTSCNLALAGSYVPTPGAASAILCPTGTFTSTVGQSVCTPSPAGSFVSTTGATSATLCAPGSYQPDSGQTSCILADIGYFVRSSGATQETLCPTGTTSDVTGSTTCRPLTPTELTNNLITIKEGMHLPQGITDSLDAKLNSVLSSLNSNQNNAAKNQLNAFINEVNAQTGKKITQAQATILIQAAQNIINSIH